VRACVRGDARIGGDAGPLLPLGISFEFSRSLRLKRKRTHVGAERGESATVSLVNCFRKSPLLADRAGGGCGA
jgi:hypothetical protein